MNYSIIGKSPTRVDAPEKVTGKAEYCSDIKLPGMLYGKALRSPVAHAKIVNIDTSLAEKLPGVRGVITGKDAPKGRFGGVVYAFDQPLMARDEVIFAGEAVAAVAADTLDIAEKAVELINVKYQELPGLFDVEKAWGKRPPVILHPDLPNYEECYRVNSVQLDPDRPNVCNHYKIRHGDVEKGFREADFIIENRFTAARIQHCCLEPNSCLARFEPDGGLTVWTGKQCLYDVKHYIMKAFNLPASRVRAISARYVGGGFGAKFMFPVEPIAVILAKKTGRAVKVALTREEIFSCGGNRISTIIDMKDGVKKDGTIVAREIKALVNVGAYAAGGGAMLTRDLSFGAASIYRVPNFKLDSYGVYTNEPPVCALRGFGSEQTIWCIESQMDIIAEKLGLDAAEIRRKNLLREGDVNPYGEIVYSIGAEGCLAKVTEFLKWPQVIRPEKGPWRRGKGFALGAQYSPTVGMSVCIVKVQNDGTVEVFYTADELGQGSSTVVAQVAAEEFGLSLDKVKLICGDTDITPISNQSLAQGTTFNTGNSVRLACLDAKRQLFEIAAEKLGTLPNDLDTREGKIYSKKSSSKSITISELYSIWGDAKDGGEILGKGIWKQPTAPDDPETGQIDPELARKGISQTVFYTHTAQGAEVAVNCETGEVKIEKFASICDMGFPINPKMCEQQMDGGVGMGIGSAFWEEIIMDRGRVLNPSFLKYKIAEAGNMPKLANYRTILAPVPHKNGPYGAKGIGEAVITASAPAIANAIYNATGIRLKDLPMNREKVFQALKQGRTSQIN